MGQRREDDALVTYPEYDWWKLAEEGDIADLVADFGFSKEKALELYQTEELIDRLICQLFNWHYSSQDCFRPEDEDFSEKLKTMVAEEIDRIDKALSLEHISKGKIKDTANYSSKWD